VFGLFGPVIQLVRLVSYLPIVAGGALRIFGRFGGVLKWLVTGPIKLLLGALRMISAAAMANPFALLMGAILLLAMVIYKNWDKIVTYIKDKIEAVRAAFADDLLKGVLTALSEFNPFSLMNDAIQSLIVDVMELLGVPDEIVKAFDEFSLWDAGVSMIQTLWDGAASLVPTMVDAISAKLSGIMPDWMKDAWSWVAGGKPEYDAPASVLPSGSLGVGALPQDTQDKLAAFREKHHGRRDQGGPVRKGMPYLVGERHPELFVPQSAGNILSGRMLRSAMAASVMASSAAAMPNDAQISERVDMRPPAVLSAPAQHITRRVEVGQIVIHAAPGMNAEDIAREVKRQLQQIEEDRSGDLHDGGSY
jgi:hypothetical protein